MKRFVAALLTLSLLAMAACGSPATISTSSTAPSTGGSVSESTTDNASSAETTGGTFTLAFNQSPQTLFVPKAPSTAGQLTLLPALEPLGKMNAEGVVQPYLAEEFITDPDKLTFTIKIPKGVKFHDDSLFTAEVLKWNLDKMVENGKASEIGNPQSFDIIDETTVCVTFKEWANNWDKVIGDILIISKDAYEKNGEDWCAINAVGTGPFKMVEYVQDNKISYQKFADYRIPDEPKVDAIEVVFITDANTQISAFLNGEIDAIPVGSDVVSKALEQAGFKNVAVQSPDIGSMGYVLFNSKDPNQPFYDLRVRQAIMHCLDFPNLAKALTDGRGVATNQFGLPGAYSYHPDVKLYEYDIAKAKALLTEAGYPNGFETKIYSNAKNQKISVALQAAMSEIGVKAEVKVVDAAVLGEMQVNESIDGLVAMAGASQMDFTQNYIRLYSSQGIKNQKTMLFPEDYEKELFAARAAKTLEEKKQHLQKASQMLVETYVLLTPVYSSFPSCYLQEGVENAGIYQITLMDWTPGKVSVKKK